MRRRLRCRAVLAVGMTAFLLGTGYSTGAAPAAAAETVRVMQFNFCGTICNKGVVAKAGNNDDVVDDIRNRILAFRPHIVTLNEACGSQIGRLEALLGGSAWRMAGVFRAQRNDDRCQDGKGFGDAVLTGGPVGEKVVLPLPNLSDEHRAILCLRTSAGGPVLACTLHLVTGKHKGNKELQLQLTAAANALNNRADGGAVIVGGDFNLRPGQMGRLLDPRKDGRFFDVDPKRGATRGQKIDYVLFSRRHFSNPSGGPRGSKFSDHKALLGSAVRY
jgi:endonuclease/exonuclease/phosphatase family metal-dependent hydrolase